MKKRILFLIHDLGPGGAEKVLVNLVNGLDREKFDVSLRTLFNWGPNRDLLLPDVKYSYWVNKNIPANSHWMKIWTPEQLYQKIIPEDFDIVVSFLEGPTARVVGGIPIKSGVTKTVSWIHTPILTEQKFSEGFRSKEEAENCYKRADNIIFVSNDVKQAFLGYCIPQKRSEILYNIFDSERIRDLAAHEPENIDISTDDLNWCGIGKLIPLKRWDRMLWIQKKLLKDGIRAHLYIIGDGPLRKDLERKAADLGISGTITFTGYLDNPYSILARCMLLVCTSEREGFSTAVTESLIIGIPVCTVDIGGMKEILGKNNEYGVVTTNDDTALYQAVKKFLTDRVFRTQYQKKATERGKHFEKDRAISKIEKMLLSL